MIGAIITIFLFAITKCEVQSGEHHLFSCDQRPTGYYADVETGCQVYHVCDGIGRQFSYTCPNNTLFQQRMLICDHWYMVNCSKSEVDYSANLLIGQRDKPFVEDSVKHPYHRTPRPDLLTASDYNYLFKNGKSEFTSSYNLVGVETDESEGSSSSNIKTRYSLPSHWFTSLNVEFTTQSPSVLRKNDYKENIIEKKSLIRDTRNTTKHQQDLSGLVLKKISNANAKTRSAFEQRSNENIKRNEENNPSTVPPHQQTKVTINEQQWKDLRKLFLIPDYEFPLDSATRPGYDNGKNSFDTSSLS